MSEEATQQAKEEKPRPEYGRPINDIIADLSKPIPDSMLSHKRQGGNDITFIPWYNATRLLDWYAPGWAYEIVRIQDFGDTVIDEKWNSQTSSFEVQLDKDGRQKYISRRQVAVTVRLSIPAAEGVISRDATGIESDTVTGYGDPTSNAESMALRRAAAKFGLGRYLYQK